MQNRRKENPPHSPACLNPQPLLSCRAKPVVEIRGVLVSNTAFPDLNCCLNWTLYFVCCLAFSNCPNFSHSGQVGHIKTWINQIEEELIGFHIIGSCTYPPDHSCVWLQFMLDSNAWYTRFNVFTASRHHRSHSLLQSSPLPAIMHYVYFISIKRIYCRVGTFWL